MSGRYDDILAVPRPAPIRPRMARADRAAQFSPFAALTGYEAVIEETGRVTEGRVELTEESRAALDEQMRLIFAREGEHPNLRLTYFVPDGRKGGGAYRIHSGRLKRVDAAAGVMIFADGTVVPLGEVVALEEG